MKYSSEDTGWKQHYPTYNFKDKEVALEEYRFATKILEADERVFLNATNLSVIAAAALGSLVLGSLEKFVDAFHPVIPKHLTILVAAFLVAGFGILSLLYFADRHKAVIFAARKVIVLRRMLGMSYGNLQLVLPNWRIEGADEPFAVKLFPGWNTYVVYPCYAIAGISSVVLFFVLSAFFKFWTPAAPPAIIPIYLIFGVTAAWFAIQSLTYRKALLDTHERPSLLFAQWLARLLNLKLVSNFEYVIYRATLAKYEMARINIDLTAARKILVHIEDKQFYSHSGISLRGVTRMALHIAGVGRRSGGSTITQQLVRTLFIEDQTKIVRRKLIEILLARWFDRVIPKKEQIDLYFASVRFERGVYGIPAAIKYFFGKPKQPLTAAQAFFLIERVSNVRSRMLTEKIIQTLNNTISAGLLDKNGVDQVIKLYRGAAQSGKIINVNPRDVERLETACRQLNL